MAASLIERLPDEGDPKRSSEESVAKDVVFVAYAGTWWPIMDVPLKSYPRGPVSGGADTVSKMNENIISLIAFLDRIVRANAIPGDGTLSRSAEESSIGN